METDSQNKEELNLEKEVERLREKTIKLETQIKDYEKRLDINQPPKELSLKDYISQLYNHSTRGDTLNKLYLLNDVKITDFRFTDSILSRMYSLGHAAYIQLCNKENRVLTFKHFCPKKKRPRLVEALTDLFGAYVDLKFGVTATSSKFLFIDGYECKGKYTPFEKL